MSDDLTFVSYLWARGWKRAAKVCAKGLPDHDRKWFENYILSRHVKSINSKEIVLNNGHVMPR